MTSQPIRQYPDEIREQAETDMLAIHPEPDLCRPVEIDGELLRVRGAHEMGEESRAALADVIRAVKRKYAAEHPKEPAVTDQTKRIVIDAPSEACILAARHLDAAEGPVGVGSMVDTATRSAITTVLRYVAKAHNSPAAPAASSCVPAATPDDNHTACDCEAEVHMGVGFYHHPTCATKQAVATPDDGPSRRNGLRQQLADAMREHYLCTNRGEADADGNMPCRCGDWHEPGAEEDDENDWDSHLADAVLTVLHREWPWLRAEAEDTPVVDPGGLRQQIAHALHRQMPGCEHDGHGADCGALADAVLAVLPGDTRTATLHEAADAIDAETSRLKADGVLESDKFRPCRDASAQLRRMAAETAQSDTGPRCTCADAGDAFAPTGHYRDCPAAPVQQPDTEEPR